MGLRRLARKSDTSSEAGLLVIWLREDAVYYGTAFTAARMARSCDELGGQKSASVRGGARFGIFFTATAQTRTRETAGASNEIIPRGGASARVFEAKPSPF